MGAHQTLDLAGRAEFGPNVERLPHATPNGLEYRVGPALKTAFNAEARGYWPGVTAGALQLACSGVRPKLTGPGVPPADFRIHGPAKHRVAGVAQLFGIESPGFTSCLGIGEHVAVLVGAPTPGNQLLRSADTQVGARPSRYACAPPLATWPPSHSPPIQGSRHPVTARASRAELRPTERANAKSSIHVIWV